MVNTTVNDRLVEQMLRGVGAYQMANFRKKDLKISSKTTPIDMVTEVDLQSEEMIVEWIKSHHPEHNILTEERDSIDQQSQYTWIIDPLDGTTNYSRGIPVFAISIALHHHGVREKGWVYLPYVDDLYSASRGEGACYNGVRLPKLGQVPLKEAVVASGFAYDHQTNPDNNIQEMSRIVPRVKGFRRMGVAAYDLCLVAHGSIDGFWERGLKPWDMEASLLMIEEVGGTVASARSWGGAEILVTGKSGCVKELLSILDKD